MQLWVCINANFRGNIVEDLWYFLNKNFLISQSKFFNSILVFTFIL